MHWLAALLVGHYPTQGAPVLVAMRWWSARGPRASFQRDEQAKLLVEQLAKWGRRVIHTFDQGFAGKLWRVQLGRSRHLQTGVVLALVMG